VLHFAWQDAVWVVAAEVNAETSYQHPPFKGEKMDNIRYIQRSLREVHPLTYEKWEDGFRRDLNVENEIEAWMHCSRCYNNFVARNALNSAEKKEAFHILAVCMNSTPTTAKEIIVTKMINQKYLDQLIDAYFVFTSSDE